jgi:AraC family transcriptional regulator
MSSLSLSGTRRNWTLPRTVNTAGLQKTSPVIPFIDGIRPLTTVAEPRLVKGGLAPWQFRNVIAYVELNISSQIKVEALAGICRLSGSHFARSFKASFGETPYNYILSKRIEMSQILMLQSNDALAQISLSCGFADQAHFCNLFRRFMGCTPTEWRSLHRSADQIACSDIPHLRN